VPFASVPQPRRRRARWLAALGLAALAHLAAFALLDFRGRDAWRVAEDSTPPETVTLARLPLARTAPAAAGQPQASARSATAATPSAMALPGVQTANPSPTPSPPAGPPGPVAAPGGGDLAAALRGSAVGCASTGAAWMSQAERDACRERLAAGADRVQHLEGMAPEKLAYYAAVAKAEQDWLSGRNPGHPPGVACAIYFGRGPAPRPPPHALVLGPCIIEPPRGSLDVDVDVLPDGGGGSEPPPPVFTTGGLIDRH